MPDTLNPDSLRAAAETGTDRCREFAPGMVSNCIKKGCICRDIAERIITAYLAAEEARGWAMRPRVATGDMEIAGDEAIDAWNHRASPWRPIPETPTPGVAPFDGETVLVVGMGANGRPMHAVASWAQPSTMFLSKGKSDLGAAECEFVGPVGTRYGVKFEWWLKFSSLPVPPLSPYVPAPPSGEGE